MKNKKRMLVVYASAGGGHFSAARAVEKAMSERYPDYEIILLDGPKLTGSRIINFFNDIYDTILKTNIKYAQYGFHILNFFKGDKSLVNIFPSVTERASKYFEKVNPDIILSVNSGVNAFITEIYKVLNWEKKVPFIICVTDPTTGFVKGWVHKDVDLMIAPLDECKAQLIDYGMPEEKIRVLKGVPINPDFQKDVKTKAEAREYLKINKEKFTVLATSGGVGTRELSIIAKELALTNLDMQIIVCCGKNEEQVKELEKFSKYASIPMKIIGFTDKMHTLMDASDIIVGKPGPAVIAEAVIKQRPLVLESINGVMHQEKGNLDYAMNNGVALHGTTKKEVIEKVKFLMENNQEYDKIVENMKKIDNASAIYNLVDMIIDYSTGEFLEIKEGELNSKINKFTEENPGFLFKKTTPLTLNKNTLPLANF